MPGATTCVRCLKNFGKVIGWGLCPTCKKRKLPKYKRLKKKEFVKLRKQGIVKKGTHWKTYKKRMFK